MASVRFKVSYNMRFPDGSSVTRGIIVLDDEKHKGLVAMLDASKGACREEAKEEVRASVAVSSDGIVAEPQIPVAPEVAPLPEEPKDEEPDWKFMQKTELRKWLSSTGVRMPRENASHKALIASCAKAWKDGARPTE